MLKQAEDPRIIHNKCAIRYALAVLGIIYFGEMNNVALGRDPNESTGGLEGSVSFRYDNFFMQKDKGRFREDRWITDGNAGGLDWLYVKTKNPDPSGYDMTIAGRTLYDNDYHFSMLMKKKNSHYLRLDFSGLRRYFDGSNEFWEAPTEHLVEKSDSYFFVDRRKYNIELGVVPKDKPQYIFGWHRSVKDGKEVLLRGAEGDTADGKTFSNIPVVSNLKGITDNLYIEASQTFAQKYNLKVRQEFEQYHDNQRLDISSYDSNGNVEHVGIQQDHLGYTNWRTMFMFDSFLDEETHLSTNYMYNYLNNNSTRDIIGYREHTADAGGNSRRTNVGTFGYLKDNLMGIENLTLSAGARIEDSKTNSFMNGASKYYNFLTHGYTDPAKPRLVSSLQDEVRVAETLRLVYKGIKRTTLSFDADLEQRKLDWTERDIHGGVFSDPDYSRTTDISVTDQVYTMKAVRRFNPAVRLTSLFRLKDIEHTYTDLLDDTTFYPGFVDSYRNAGRELKLKTDWRLNSKLSSTLMYQFIQESIDTSLGGKTQNMEIHQGAGSCSWYPGNNLYFVGTFMLENYKLSTPAVGVATTHAQGATPYDFRGNSYSLLLDGTYAFNDRTSCDFGLQHTEALGEVDSAGDNVFNKAYVTLKLKHTKNQAVSVGYVILGNHSMQ